MRYAYLCNLPSSRGPADSRAPPTWAQYEACAAHFERALDIFLRKEGPRMDWKRISLPHNRTQLAAIAHSTLSNAPDDSKDCLGLDLEVDLVSLCRTAVDAFFDNDLMHTMRMFLADAKGSFGLCMTSSMVGQPTIDELGLYRFWARKAPLFFKHLGTRGFWNR